MTYFNTFLMLFAAISAIGVYLFIAVNNRLVALDTRCDTAFADIDVHLKHRHNIIPGLVETVRGFAVQERDILTQVTQARARACASMAPEDKLDSEKQLSQNIVALMNIAEQYPELKSSAHFRELRAELIDAENRITASRRFYNLAIDEYNATLRQFPGSYVGDIKRLALRRPFDLGFERIMLDEPVAFKF